MRTNPVRPLSDHARNVLRGLQRGAVPTLEINPGVVSRLMTEKLASIVMLPSPYPTHKGKYCNHLQITDAGRTRAAEQLELP